MRIQLFTRDELVMVLDEVGEQIKHFWFEVYRRPCQAERAAVGVEFVGIKDVDHDSLSI